MCNRRLAVRQHRRQREQIGDARDDDRDRMDVEPATWSWPRPRRAGVEVALSRLLDKRRMA